MPRRGRRRAIATNIYADGAGLEAVARATVDGQELTRSRRYPRDTPIKDIRSWQRDAEAELRKLTGVDPKHTFAERVEDYLPLVREELVSFADRERHLRAWIPVFGTKKLHQVKTPAIDLQLRRWRNVDGLSASTVNQRRDALNDFFLKLQGPEGNPVKAAVWFARTKSAPKAIDRSRIWRVLSHMDPDRKTRWRLSLMHWTGMRPSQMGRLQSADDFYIDDRAFVLEVNGAAAARAGGVRAVGEGRRSADVSADARRRGRRAHFLRVDAFWRPPEKAVDNIDPKLQRKPRQTWSCPSAYKRIVAAAKAIGELPFTVYAIKHSFASGLLNTGTDASVIQEMLGHVDIKSTLVYARSVQATHVQALDRLRADDQRRYTLKVEAVSVAPNRGTAHDAA
jgi:integrase